MVSSASCCGPGSGCLERQESDEQAVQGAVREFRLRFHALDDDRDKPRQVGEPGARKAGLSDAGRPREDDGGPARRRRRGQQVGDGALLRLPADERGQTDHAAKQYGGWALSSRRLP
jgi:hypothetical protein